MILHGDCLVRIKEIADCSVDAIVTDPPYELGFMGKSWDKSGIANNVEMWRECLRVLKPGGHLLAFSGTRTYHRMASAIEDAGFEVRDMIEWVYGSGFPKSLNIGKAVDKLQGNEREVVGHSPYEGRRPNKFGGKENGDICYGDYKAQPEMLVDKGTSEWEGWGTALKPSHENICVAHKTLDSRSVLCYTIISITQKITEVLSCQLKSNALIVEKNLKLSQVVQSVESDIALWNAVKSTNILEDLLGLTDMLQSKEMEYLNLNTVLLCLNFLIEVCEKMSTYTTEMETSLTIELKTLNSLLSEDILASIIQHKEIEASGKNVNVFFVENYLNAVLLRWNAIQTLFVQGIVTSKEKDLNFAPNHEPICMARKPLSEKTVAENVLKWGTGGINIDESRVETSEDLSLRYKSSFQEGNSQFVSETATGSGKRMKLDEPDGTKLGRFPANLIHDGSDEVVACFPESKSTLDKSEINRGTSKSWFTGDHVDRVQRGDSGNASRFFKSIIYTAKASKSERNVGLKGEEKIDCDRNPDCYSADVPFNRSANPKINNHPTVKPVALMEYLIKMVSREGQTILDPFMGSGTTGMACKKTNRNFIGIELSEDYIKIAEARIEHAMSNKPETLDIFE